MILERIVVSAKEPLNKNVLWIDGTDIKYWGPNGWSGLDVTENDKLWTSIQEEIKDREDADIAITEKLDKEIQDRINAITTVTEALNKEVSDRQEADTSLEERLNQRIDDEIADREEGDTGLTNKLNQEIADRKAADTAIQTDLDTFKSTKGEASGLAPLNESGKVDSQYLPSFVDDVIEVYATYDKDEVGDLSNVQLYADPEHQTPITGETGKIYVNITEGEPNYNFRWSGTQFSPIDTGGLILGEITGTAYDGGKGKATTDTVNSLPEYILSSLSVSQDNDSRVGFKIRRFKKESDGEYAPYSSGTSIAASNTTTAGVMTADDRKLVNQLNKITGVSMMVDDPITSDETKLYLNYNTIITRTGSTDSIVKHGKIIPASTPTTAGVMTAADKQKLDGLKEGTELETELQGITEDITNLSDKVGSNTYTDANYISKETNLTDAVLQLDEEIKATNDNLALEHTNAESTYAKKTDLNAYLSLSGGTMTGPINITWEGIKTSQGTTRLLSYNDSEFWLGTNAFRVVLETSNNDVVHRKNDTNYVMYDGSNFKAGTNYLAPNGVTIADINNLGNNWSSVLANNVQSKNFTVNGASRSVYAPSTETFSIYAPTTSGTSGLVLVSRGEGQAPEWETMAEDLGDLSSTHYIQSATSVREALIALDAKIYELFQTLTLNQ